MIKAYFLVFFLTIITICKAQIKKDTTKKDSIGQLKTVTVRGYLNEQPRLSVPASVAVITAAQLAVQPDNSFISVLNTTPGVRAEERSPGSYRLSIRGSLLRSPFGIRDIKVYYDDIPLTDAGGNTYLNAIDFNSIHNIEILKGPDGSLFGANSGGVVLLSPIDRHADSSFVAAGFNGGSYGLVHENAVIQSAAGNNIFTLNQAYQSYQGYRQHSAMERNYLQATDQVTFSPKDNLRVLGFYSDLDYETPGGLTLSQYQTDPSEARTATAFVPGAIGQKAAIYQKIVLGGVVNEVHLSDQLRNITSIFGSYVNFSNPFITNYEQRYESTYGFRSYFEYAGKRSPNYNWLANAGIEWQQTNADINNYGNRMGIRDTAQTLDKVNTNQHFIFARYLANAWKRLHVEAALSLNFYDYKFRNIYPNDEANFTNRGFNPEFMPRLAVSYTVTGNFIWRASISRGYSTPAIAEIRPTDNIINTSLQAEYGINYETGFRLKNNDETMFLDASVFYYNLKNAIEERLNPDETEYYVNSGGTHQPGLEVYFTDWIIKQNKAQFIRGLQFSESVTIDKFTFSDTHLQLTGVPEQVLITGLQVLFPQHIYAYAEYNYTARLPLNDANTVFAPHYNLVQAKAGWEHVLSLKTKFKLYAGIDNLLNEKYSLGDDLNAVGSRYYNAATPRNYYAGFSIVY